MFRDKYTNFSFRDRDSSSFKVWITNKNDLKRNMSPNFSDKFNNPSYSQTRYLESTNIDKQDFKFSCVAIDVTLNEWRAITEWLSPLQSGKLRFDWNEKYYYMVKLSKAPSGVMFMQGKIDNVMGQLYNITFDLEFTTTNDWAALGEYNEQSNVYDNGELIINNSIYNNPYYCPSILLTQNKEQSKVLNAADYIFGSDRLGIKIDNMPSDTVLFYIYDYSGSQIGYCKIESGALRHYHLYKTNNGIETWYNVVTDKSDDLYLIDYNINNYVVSSVNGLNVKQMWLGRNIINNISSLDIYPIFYTRGSATIKYNNTTYYKYTVINDSITYDPFVVVDSKHATVQCSGQIIELVKDSRGAPIFDGTSTVNNGIISIPTGRPELIKAELSKVVENENTKVVQLTFKINNQPLYDRYKQSTVHIFNKGLIKELNSYNKSLYGGNLYTINSSNYTNITLLNSAVFYNETKQGWTMTITYQKDSNVLQDYSTATKLTMFEEERNLNIYYISICDSADIDVDSENTYSIGLQGREVI